MARARWGRAGGAKTGWATHCLRPSHKAPCGGLASPYGGFTCRGPPLERAQRSLGRLFWGARYPSSPRPPFRRPTGRAGKSRPYNITTTCPQKKPPAGQRQAGAFCVIGLAVDTTLREPHTRSRNIHALLLQSVSAVSPQALSSRGWRSFYKWPTTFL